MNRMAYCQFLLVSQINYTLTYYAEHKQVWSHDTIRNFLKRDSVRPRDIWESARNKIVVSPNGYLLFDDSVMDKDYSKEIELVRRQYSGNAKAVIRGIGVVSCVYVNPDTGEFWDIDYRIYDPEGDGKSKLKHVRDMLEHTVTHKKVGGKPLSFTTVLMDSWYADTKTFKCIESYGKIYYCPLKSNRLVDQTNGTEEYRHVDSLEWTEQEQEHGKLAHIKTMPKGHRVKLFRLVLSTERTDFVATNDLSQDSTEATFEICRIRWKIEQFFRETKQTTGIESCQCRLERIQRNHIGCALLVWLRLKQLAYETKQTVYQLKFGLLDNYMREQLQSPDILMAFS